MNMSRTAKMVGLLRWLSSRSALLAFGLALLSAVQLTTADGVADAAQPQPGLPAPAPGTLSDAAAQALHAELVQGLSQIQLSVQKCDAFLERFGNQPAVANVLQQIQTRAGRTLFTSPATITELQQIVGEPIQLGQRDLELCLQLQDRNVGAPPSSQKNFSTIDTRLGKCLSTLQQIGPNPAVLTEVRLLSRQLGGKTFTSRADLESLEQAAGRDLGLSQRELETCVEAYDTQAALTALTSAGVSLGSAINCPPPGELCQGTEPGQICCTGALNVCAQACDDEGDCEPYCEPCFPSDATVSMQDGSTRRMADLKIGDRVAVIRPDGSRGFEDIYLFTHKDQTAAAVYITLTLESGRKLTLSPRHFIPVATDRGARWQARVLKGGNEVRVGDVVWFDGPNGVATASPVIEIAREVRPGLYNPLTLGGTIVVDGVAASAHSDWFLDGLVSADTQGKVYQAMFLPVRAIYHVIGPTRMETVAEHWGVVDFLREATARSTSHAAVGWVMAGLAGVLLALAGGLLWRRQTATQ